MKFIAILIIALLIGGAYGQDFVKPQTIQLSGANASIFEGSYFKHPGWVFDPTSYSATPSMTAFLKDDANDGRPIGMNKTPLRCGGNWK